MEPLAGYQPIRLLGEGPRSRVWLGRFEEPDAAQSNAQLSIDPQLKLVAIKRFRKEIPGREIAREIEALSRAPGRHVLELLDLSSDREGRPLLVLQRLRSQSLADFLRRRRPTPGEAVTILAPLAASLIELHRAGVIHNRIEPASICFDDSGAPVLSAFGSATVLEQLPGATSGEFPVARLSSEAGVTGDLVSLLKLSRLVLGEWADCLDGLSEPGETDDPSEWLKLLGSRLFSLTEPEPVNFNFEEQIAGQLELPNRIGTEPAPPSAAGDGGGVSDYIAPGSAGSESIAKLIAAAGSALARLRIRPRAWFIAGGGLIIVLLTLVIPSRPADVPAGTAVPSASVEPEVKIDQLARLAIRGDDPLAAAKALLEVRRLCLRSFSQACLDEVDQAESALLDSDQFQIQSARETGADISKLGFEPDDLDVLQHLGDTVLLGIGDPIQATLLMVREEDGWKLRDLLEPAVSD